MKKFAHSALAGTFDRLHTGHKKLIDEAFLVSERVSIGITVDLFITNKFLSSQIQPFLKRESAVKEYLKEKHFLSRAHFFPLSDIYGIAKDDTSLQALFVTPETEENAKKVNVLRKSNGLSQLDIVVAPLVKSTDGEIISSERIRGGEIDSDGTAYTEFFVKKDVWQLPEELRGRLRIPLGVVVGEADDFSKTTEQIVTSVKNHRPPLTVAVGDIIVWELRKAGNPADIEIIDLKSKREKVEFPGLVREDAIHINNDPGTISSAFVVVYQKAVEKFLQVKAHSQIFIEGEEDLTALPAILLSPLGSIVLYGHFELGVVLVEVTLEKKKELRKIIEKFV